MSFDFRSTIVRANSKKNIQIKLPTNSTQNSSIVKDKRKSCILSPRTTPKKKLSFIDFTDTKIKSQLNDFKLGYGNADTNKLKRSRNDSCFSKTCFSNTNIGSTKNNKDDLKFKTMNYKSKEDDDFMNSLSPKRRSLFKISLGGKESAIDFFHRCDASRNNYLIVNPNIFNHESDKEYNKFMKDLALKKGKKKLLFK